MNSRKSGSHYSMRTIATTISMPAGSTSWSSCQRVWKKSIFLGVRTIGCSLVSNGERTWSSCKRMSFVILYLKANHGSTGTSAFPNSRKRRTRLFQNRLTRTPAHEPAFLFVIIISKISYSVSGRRVF